MKFSAIIGVLLQLSRKFSSICKWVLLKMSLNCKVSSFLGFKSHRRSVLKKTKESLQISGGAWKCRARLLAVWILGVIFRSLLSSSNLNHGVLTHQERLPHFYEGNATILLKYFNVSTSKLQPLASLLSEQDQMASLEHSKLWFDMARSNDTVCALKVECLEKQESEKQHRSELKYDKHKEVRYKSQEESAPWKIDFSMVENFLSFFSLTRITTSSPGYQTVDDDMLKARTSVDPMKVLWDNFFFCPVDKSCSALLGIIIVLSICYKLRRVQKDKHMHEKPMAQPQKQLPQQIKQEKAKGPLRHATKWRDIFLVLFMFIGLLVAIFVFYLMNNDVVIRRKETLINMCDERARMLQDQFNVSINHVHALAVLISTFHHGKHPSAIDQKTFEEYTERTAFERPLTSGVAYALKVLDSERQQFEKLHGWTIKKMEIEDQTPVQDSNTENLDPSPSRTEYAPVILSQKTVSHIVSIDMMSGKEDRDNILRARASGKGVLTSPFKLLKSNNLGVVLTFPVYCTDPPPNATPEQRVEATLGYLGASYDVHSLVEKLLQQLASKQTIVVNVYDTTNDSAPIKMYGPEVIDRGLSYISHLDFGDPSRKHEMHCRFKHKPPLPCSAIMALAGILVITFLLCYIFYDDTKRIKKVEDENDELMELKHRAEAADVAKSQFLATVSHEIRTPIHAVLGMLSQLMDTELDANQLFLAQTAWDSGKDLISLINEVLDQAKIESGRLELEAEPFDLCGAIDNILSLFSGRSHEEGIEMAAYVSEQVPEVVIGDPRRFRQIITNLIGNSIKFTHNKGHIFLSVFLANEVTNRLNIKDEVLKQDLNLTQEDSSKNISNTLSGLPVVDRWKCWEKFKKLNETNSVEDPEVIKLLITVEDTGMGIHHDAQCRIFTPFMQADSSTSRKHGGTGIGLSISKRLVDLMGGEIVFLSEPDIGSTFSFTVTFRKGETCSPLTERQPCDLTEFRGLKALVVDGRRMRAEVTRYHLQRLCICVDTVSSLKCACSYLSSVSEQLAMVLVDEDMCDNDADHEFQHQIQKLRTNGSIKAPNLLPKVYLLVKSMNPSMHGGLKTIRAVGDVLSKPLHLGVLVACFQAAHGIGKRRHSRKRAPSVLGSLLKQRRILVVDDNVVNQKVAEGALKKYDAFVSCVGRGKDAVERLTPPHHFDACFMDLQMPEMDGFEATRRIRLMEREFHEKLESRKAWHTPILAMTADVIQSTYEECMKCGMDGYVSKPFEEQQLYSAVVQVLDGIS